MNGCLLAATLLYPVIVAIAWHQVPWFGAVLLGFFLLHLLALGMLALGKYRLGFALALVAGFVYFPVGLLGLIGARQVGDQATAREFENG